MLYILIKNNASGYFNYQSKISKNKRYLLQESIKMREEWGSCSGTKK